MGKYVWPCPNYSRVSSQFGSRINPMTHKRETHLGVDLACPAGKPILATKSGKVVEAQFRDSYGNNVLLDHGQGLRSRYAHASKLLVSAGDQVKAGQTIALVGSTGNSTGAHLHFEIIVSGKHQNPINYVAKKDTIDNYQEDGRGVEASSNNNSSSAPPEESKEIKGLEKKITIGAEMTAKRNEVLKQGAFLGNGCEIVIQNDQFYVPILKDEICWETERKNTPGKLTFTVVKDAALNFQEGNPVRFRAYNKDVFFGYVFEKQRSDKDFISVTCYDQLRYLKNKDSLHYEAMKYSDLLQLIAKNYGFQCGTIEDTGYVIPARIEEATLFDILGNASDLTLLNTEKLYVLYDDFGKLSLRNVESMSTGLMIDEDVACGYSYSSSIDKDTYNKIILAYDNKQTQRREINVVQDGHNLNKWGVLQYYQKIDDNTTNIQETGKLMLDYYNKKSRSLSVSKILGDVRVRAGSSLTVNLGLGDINVSNQMLVEKVKHTFSNGEHFMDVTLAGMKGGNFVV